jgi:bifunctional enzyme CysN/CysC
MVKPGDPIRAQPSGRESRVTRIVTANGDLPLAVAGQSITLTLADEIDISRGDVISACTSPAEVADQFECTVVWMAEEPMLPGRAYLLKIGALTLSATLAEPKYRIHVNTLEHLAAKRLDLNEIGVCNVAMDRPVPFDPYASNRDTGGFILIDRMTNHTVAAGMLHFALRRSHNIHVQPVDIDKTARAAQKYQRPAVLWFTGLSGAGKSTIANLVDKKLHALGRHSYLLDGDNVRHGLCRDLGFTDADRIENIRRVAETAKLMVDAGLVVLTAFISPFRAERAMARGLFADGEFIEIHVDTPLAVAEERDVKGLYRKARRGELANFTGIDSPYEAPERPRSGSTRHLEQRGGGRRVIADARARPFDERGSPPPGGGRPMDVRTPRRLRRRRDRRHDRRRRRRADDADPGAAVRRRARRGGGHRPLVRRPDQDVGGTVHQRRRRRLAGISPPGAGSRRPRP